MYFVLSKALKNVIESELWCICEETLFLYSALSTVEVEDNPNLNILLIVFEEFSNTVIRLWHWKIFLLLWRVLCFKIRYSYSWKPCNLLACRPHRYHRCSEVKCWASEVKSHSCGHTLPECSSSQVQQAWRSKRHRQATFNETSTCAALCFYDFVVQFGLTNTNEQSFCTVNVCTRRQEGFWCAKILEGR